MKIKKGDSLKKAKEELKFPYEDGHIVWCYIPSSTTTRGNSYLVRNIFAYRNKYSYGYDWDYFITIKNDDNYTIKMNANKFRRHHPDIPEMERLELRIKKLEDALNIKI